MSRWWWWLLPLPPEFWRKFLFNPLCWYRNDVFDGRTHGTYTCLWQESIEIRGDWSCYWHKWVFMLERHLRIWSSDSWRKKRAGWRAERNCSESWRTWQLEWRHVACDLESWNSNGCKHRSQHRRRAVLWRDSSSATCVDWKRWDSQCSCRMSSFLFTFYSIYRV